tara:strand:+ start:396 stop:779 length:384 start_codon:yes stop_codon:yes gene_type:complete
MLRSFTYNAIFKNQLSIWLLVVLAALFQLPVSTTQADPISHERIELVESNTFITKRERVHLFDSRYESNKPETSSIAPVQQFHDQLTINVERLARKQRFLIVELDRLKRLPLTTPYEDEIIMTEFSV